MAGENLGASFSIDVTDLKAGLAQANRLIRNSESEFRAAAAGMDDWSSSQEGLTRRVETLTDQVDIQKQKVAALISEKQRIINKMTAEGKSNEEIERAIDGVNKQITRESTQLDRLKADLDKSEKSLDEFGDSSEDAGSKLDGLKKVGGLAVTAIAAVGAAAAAAVTGFFALAESTRESRENMAKLETAFTTAGHSAEAATETYESLYGILGDDGQATEAAAHLAQLTTTQEELADWTNIATGVYATFGDSLPIESLTEAANETAKTGAITGTLADALNWAGVSEEEFQASLDACTTEQERQALITSTLNGLYAEAADKYKEVNADVIAAQEAQAELNSALNELGAIAEPIMTMLKTLATDLLVSITPFVSLIGDGLTGAFEGTAGAADTLAEGLTGIIETLVNTVITMLPFIIDTIVAVVPQLITALLEQTPSILAMLLEVANTVILALSEVLPTILTTIMSLIPLLINQLIASIPLLLDASITLLMSIVQALPTIVTSLIEALPTLIETIITSLTESIPILLNAAIELLMAVVEAIPTIVDSLILALPQIIDCIVNGLITALPQVLQGAITLLLAIIQAIPTIVNSLIVALPQIISAITSTLVANAPLLLSTAVQLFMAIVQAIPQILGSLITGLGSIVSTIFTTLGTGLANIWEIGQNIVYGIWDGISGAATWLWDQITGWVSGIIGGIKGLLGINSPSRVMADLIGKNMALGIGEGFEDNIGAVNKMVSESLNFDTPSVNVGSINASGGLASPQNGVVVYQTNNYSQAHSRYEIYQSQRQTAAAVRLAMGGAY